MTGASTNVCGRGVLLFITRRNTDMQIFAKKGQGALFVLSQSGHRQKQMGLNILGSASSEQLYCSLGQTGSAGSVEV